VDSRAKEFAPDTTATSMLAAQQLGVKVGQIAKSLLFVGKDGRFFMVVSPGDVSTAAVTRSVTGRWQEDPHLDSGCP
jgi:prolyl-tRNA editing enzyme YbaK/EbsC (Cys-tRNA(Pro) deacylase)